MSLKHKLVLAMLATGAGSAAFVYLLSHNLKLSLAIGGILLLTDLHFVPKMLPHIFGRDTRKK